MHAVSTLDGGECQKNLTSLAASQVLQPHNLENLGPEKSLSLY